MKPRNMNETITENMRELTAHDLKELAAGDAIVTGIVIGLAANALYDAFKNSGSAFDWVKQIVK